MSQCHPLSPSLSYASPHHSILTVLPPARAADTPSSLFRRFPLSCRRDLAQLVCLSLVSPLSVCAADRAAGFLPRATLASHTRVSVAPSLLPSRARASLPAVDEHLALKKVALARSRYGLSGFFSHLEPPRSRVTSPLVPQTALSPNRRLSLSRCPYLPYPTSRSPLRLAHMLRTATADVCKFTLSQTV